RGSDARWAHDGTRIVDLADGEPKGTQLFVRWMDAEGASSQVARVSETPTDPKWAPGGESIAFVMLVPDSSLWTISLPKPPEGAKWTPAPRVVDDLHYRQDRVGYMEQGFTHLFLVPADGGTARQLTTGHWNVGARFDGVAFTGYDSTEHTHRTSDLFVAGIDGSGMRDVSHGFDRDPGDLFWAPDGKGVYFTAGDRGSINVHFADLSGGVRDATQGVQVVS